MTKTPAKFQKDLALIVGRSFACTRYPVSIGFNPKMTEFKLQNKSAINQSEDYSQRHAHFHTLTKTYVKFQKDQVKTIGGVAFTRYQVSTSFK